nr:prolyl oligopeptidase family serine peptidase [Sphingobium sp. BHU LFT2]
MKAPNADFWRPYALSVNAARIDTPILMQLADSEYLYALETIHALEGEGKPVEAYIFPDERHIKWQPAHRLAIYERNLAWFERWLMPH